MREKPGFTALTINLTRGYPIDLLPPIFRAKKIMEEEKSDIIHTVSPGSAGLCGLYCSKRLDIPLVSSFHTLVPQYERYHMKKYLSDLFSFDERRLKKGVAGKIIHNLIRNAILFINLYVGLPESLVESDWGYW